MEKSLSTFANEMASSAMILGISSPNSLILIDELGRGTSPREGVGISHAIAEHLIKLKVRGLFEFQRHDSHTCASPMCSLLRMYPVHVFPFKSHESFGPYRHFNELVTTLSRQPSVVK